MTKTLKIATRKSPLALWQAEYVKARLESIHADLTVELVPMSTRGDKILDTPLAKIGGKGLFVKELEMAMLENRADIAVHSMKDVPMEFPEGLGLAVICEREDPRDAFVSNTVEDFNSLPQGAKVGTSSLRRQCQIRATRPDLQLLDCRGNVGTRLQKLDNGEYDAIILATAGLVRLELPERIRHSIEADDILPACGQGAVGIETRLEDEAVMELLAPLNHRPTELCVLAERAMNQTLQGGCQVPIGGFATLNDAGDTLSMTGLVGDVSGQKIIQHSISGRAEDAVALGTELAKKLLADGAAEILNALEH